MQIIQNHTHNLQTPTINFEQFHGKHLYVLCASKAGFKALSAAQVHFKSYSLHIMQHELPMFGFAFVHFWFQWWTRVNFDPGGNRITLKSVMPK